MCGAAAAPQRPALFSRVANHMSFAAEMISIFPSQLRNGRVSFAPELTWSR
jgi:hypothetical protein